MQQRSKLTAVTLSAVALAAAACGSTSKATSSTSSPASSASSTTSGGGSSASAPLPAANVASKHYSVVYIGGVGGNPFYTSVACGATVQAKAMGVAFSQQEPQTYDPTVQVPIVNAVVAQHPNAIMIAVDSATALVSPLQRAQKAGIKVLTVDGVLSTPGVSITNVQSDDFAGGQLAGNTLAQEINGKGTVVAIYNKPGSSVSDARVKGFATAIAKYPGIHYLGVQSSNNETALAASTIQDEILSHPSLNGVFTVTTNNTEGVATGIKTAGKVGKVKIVGYDTSAPIVADIQAGEVSADIVQAPYRTGEEEIVLAVDSLEGKTVPTQVLEPFVVATPQNINTANVQAFIYKTSC